MLLDEDVIYDYDFEAKYLTLLNAFILYTVISTVLSLICNLTYVRFKTVKCQIKIRQYKRYSNMIIIGKLAMCDDVVELRWVIWDAVR